MRHRDSDVPLVYDFNLLVSHGWWNAHRARQEILGLLREFGDDHPAVASTAARGLSGVKSNLNNRYVISSLIGAFRQNPQSVQFTLKWTPIDLWCDVESMKEALSSIRREVGLGERWMMHVEKRRYATRHKAEIIEELAALIEEKVDLRNPDKIVWIEIVGNQAGMSVLKPGDVFSLYRLRGY